MQDVIIRRAVAGDRETLARLGRATFSETFGHLYPPVAWANAARYEAIARQFVQQFIDRDGLGNPRKDIADMAKGLFSGKS